MLNRTGVTINGNLDNSVVIDWKSIIGLILFLVCVLYARWVEGTDRLKITILNSGFKILDWCSTQILVLNM